MNKELLVSLIVIIFFSLILYVISRIFSSSKNNKNHNISYPLAANKKLPPDLFYKKDEKNKVGVSEIKVDVNSDLPVSTLTKEEPSIIQDYSDELLDDFDFPTEEFPITHDFIDDIPEPDYYLSEELSATHDFKDVDSLIEVFPPEIGELEVSIQNEKHNKIPEKRQFKSNFHCAFVKQEFNTNQIKSLYHFTDKSNLQSIIDQGGIYSYEELTKKGIVVSKHASTDFSRRRDSQKGLGNYVRLTFSQNHPMMWVAKKNGTIPNPILLMIDTEVAVYSDTLYADKNALRNNFNYGGSLDDFKKIRMNVVKQFKHFDLSEEDTPYYQAEIMVKSFIPVSCISNISKFKL